MEKSGVSQGQPKTPPDPCSTRSLQLRRVRRPGDGGELRRQAVRRTHRPDSSRRSGTGARASFLAMSRAAACSIWRPARDVRPWRWPNEVLSSPASTHHRRCWLSPGSAPPTHGSRSSSPKATRTHWRMPDRSFDAVVCLRMLMHVPDWRKALSELCRVSRERLVFDYPAVGSMASLQVMWRRIASAMGSNVEAYRVFSAGDIARELDRHAFRIVSAHKQFVLPIALHKTIGSAGLTRGVERRAGQRRRPAHRRVTRYDCSRTVRVLVTGATGFTGGHLARTLAHTRVSGPRARPSVCAGARPRRRRHRSRRSGDT